MIPAFLAKPAVKYVLMALAVAGLVVGVVLYLDGVRRESRKAGAAEVTGAVQKKTIETIDSGRKDKEAADEKARTTPYDERVDGLR